MRLVVDLQACQTEASAGRGVGRYSFEFARSLVDAGSNHDVRFVLNAGFQECAASLRRELAFTASPNRFSTYSYPNPTEATADTREFRRAVGEAIASSHWMRLQPDVLHISHVFEGFGSRAVVPEIPRCPGVTTSATLYDLIPLRFPELYLVDPGFKKWYLRHLGRLRQFDLLLAISNSARQDAIELLGISPDRIVTIWGGVGSRFRVAESVVEERETVLKRCGIGSRFVLYTGGDDHRKNIKGLIRGFSALPVEIRKSTQLAIVCSLRDSRRAMYLEFARGCGLRSGEVVFTGFVLEEDLVSLYNLCDAFVFPSLYEGFGLPVVEAMACGAPVVGANNSSIREILDYPDALFDPKETESIANAIERVLTDQAFATELRRYGRARARTFSWDAVASRALEAYEAATVGAKAAGGERFQMACLGRKRLAVFTPLPPCRSGIADYNAAFLPFLNKHFEIDVFIDDYEVSDEFLLANFRIRPHRDFERLHANYDAVLYEMGNSEFHAYMLDYLERFPGIVGLHDAYLSGLFGYLDYYAGETGRYQAEMLEAHTTRARRFFAPVMKCDDPVFKSMIELPATKRVLDHAIGVISHSPFNREVSEKNYPEGWAAPFRVIKQMVLPRLIVSSGRRSEIRRRLGYADDEFVVATFGHVAWTKMGDVLLSAFETCCAKSASKLRLVYAGEFSGDDFGLRLRESIRESRFASRIRVAGFLSASAYDDYLSIADVAIQLRKNSRGGTPKGVLDCLAAGVPVIANNEASYTDYPDTVIYKIEAQPSAQDLSAAIERYIEEENTRDRFSDAGRRYVSEEHSPDRISSEYAIVVNEVLKRASFGSSRRMVRAAIRYSDPGSVDPGEALGFARAIRAEVTQTIFSKQRILVDLSHIVESDHGTGIQRVVRNLVRELACSGEAGVDFVFVLIDENQELRSAMAWMLSQRIVTEAECEENTREGDAISLRASDTLLMLDSSWARFDSFKGVFDRLSGLGGRVFTVVYDLLPIKLPQYFVPGGSQWFRIWFEKAVAVSDGLICISRAVADDVVQFLAKDTERIKRPLRIGWWHLGGNFSGPVTAEPGAEIVSVFAQPALLMVGTIEPRKGHGLALDALEQLWRDGVSLRLCVVGRRGWLDDELIQRFRNHPSAGRLLFFFEGLPDEQLNYCYRHAAGLFIPSFGEGFGLPIIEAAQHGTPVIASDLAVFHEIAEEQATYVRTSSAELLAADLWGWFRDFRDGKVPDSRCIKWKTWEESAGRLCAVLIHNEWYTTLDGGSG